MLLVAFDITWGESSGGGGASRDKNFLKLCRFDVPVSYPQTKTNEQETKFKL